MSLSLPRFSDPLSPRRRPGPARPSRSKRTPLRAQALHDAAARPPVRRRGLLASLHTGDTSAPTARSLRMSAAAPRRIPSQSLAHSSGEMFVVFSLIHS